MDFLELAKNRFSCRSFKPDAVEDEKILEIIEAARIAPSAVNYQPWQFYIVRDSVNKAKIIESYPREWIQNAPVLIVACGDKQLSWKRGDGKDHLDIDLSIAIDHITLQATNLGLGTCWVCNFQVKKLREVMQLPSHLEPVAIIPIGYPQNQPDTERHNIKRKPLEEIIKWEI
jgi:nitroreductase